MGAAEYEWGALPQSLKRICKNFNSFIIFPTDIYDHKGNKLMLFIERDKVKEYDEELKAYLSGKRHLKAWINIEDHISGMTGFGLRKRPIEEKDGNDIWWDIVNDVWFTFIPEEIENIKQAILNTRNKKKEEKNEGWY
jgi:hypothetical protein